MFQNKIILTVATDRDRKIIYKIRYTIYSSELKQHPENLEEVLTDDLDLVNQYIVAKYQGHIIGFISITSPISEKYSVDKYFSRTAVPYTFDEKLYEIRLLTVIKQSRNNYLANVLMYAAFRWVQSHGGSYIVAICRSDLAKMYIKAGLQLLNVRAQSGKVTYQLAVATIEDLQKMMQKKVTIYKSLKGKIDWQLPFMFFAPSECFHGGSFFKAIGEDLQTLQKAEQIINADVLDAWFPPSPEVLSTLTNNLSWLLRTSPPTHAEGIIKIIAESRGVNKNSILTAAGSSNLIFLALRSLLNRNSNVLIIDPCYGEYIHVLENIVQCQLTKFNLNRELGFIVNTDLLLQEIKKGYDMVIIINPNSPTGVYIPKEKMVKMLLQIPQSTLIWIDETYIEYAGLNKSLEQFASKTENIIVCKSMSKVYALSGVRAAYLCCSPHLLETLKHLTPPWSLSLLAQAAAIAALKDSEYYKEKYTETHVLRNNLKRKLFELGITEVIDGMANFLLFYLPDSFPPKDIFLDRCKKQNLFLRDVHNMGKNLGNNAIRIAIKDKNTNNKMIDIIAQTLIDIEHVL